MSKIDSSARIEDGAVIADDAVIGPYCTVGAHVKIGAGTKLIAHVHVTADTTIGEGCTVYPFVSLGTPPQSLGYRGELTKLTIGNGCTIREGRHYQCWYSGGWRHHPRRRTLLPHEQFPYWTRLHRGQRCDLRDIPRRLAVIAKWATSSSWVGLPPRTSSSGSGRRS